LTAFHITGGAVLEGEVPSQGSKNAVLPILCSTLLTDEEVNLDHVPALSDVQYLSVILAALGKTVEKAAPNQLTITQKASLTAKVPLDLIQRMRASFLIFGPLLARAGEAEIAFPGGDAIGTRPVDIHIEGLRAMGAEIEVLNDRIVGRAGRLRPADFTLRFPSVGATEHLMLTAASIPNQTTLRNTAQEPEIEDLAQVLTAMGAEIQMSDGEIVIQGQSELGSASHSIISDRLVAGTFMIAAALCGQEVKINCIPDHVSSLIRALREIGVGVQQSSDAVIISKVPFESLNAISIETAPYPGFATDHHPMIVPLLAHIRGESRMTERVFEGRFKYIPELVKMGADVHIQERTAIIKGVERLKGTSVESLDIRAGVALVLAALKAEGKTIIDDESNHIARGYADLGGDLLRLGAEISIK